MRMTWRRGALLGVGLVLAVACSGLPLPVPAGECELPPPPPGRSEMRSPARVNPGAIAGYESVDATFHIVEGDFPDVSGCDPHPHSQPLTRAPGNRIDGEEGDPYRHIDRLTWIPGGDNLAVGDLFLHGDGPRYVAARGVDLRKFLYQDIILLDCAEQSCDPERLPGPGNVWKGGEPAPDGFENEPFDSDRFGCIRNVHGFFAEFNRIAKKIAPHDGGDDLRLHLTNNCREPGNYEVALVSASQGKLFKDHVSLDIDFYSQVLEQIDVALGDLGTGLRVVGTERRSDGTYVYEDVEPKDFPAHCALVNLAPYVGKAQRLLTKDPVALEIPKGAIPYEAFSDETNQKSGLTGESIVYVEVARGPPPTDFAGQGFWFQEADDGVIERFNTKKSWKQLVAADTRGGPVHAPHTFATFEDVLAYPFAISAFEVDGRYLGRMPDKRLTDETKRLYGFDYGYLKRIDRAEVRGAIQPNGRPDTEPPRLEFRLLDRGCTRTSCVNLIIGNIQLEPGEATSMVFGIGTQPLSDDYAADAYQPFQQYALTYDAAGELTELVGKHGLGLAVVRRGRAAKRDRYTIDLVAYERAVPLWRAIVAVPGTRRPGRSGTR